jgi:4-amino-4-deoxy-L-arabinose transferase-like glycosyltransferase
MKRFPIWLPLLIVVPRLILFFFFSQDPNKVVTIDAQQYLTIAKNIVHHHAFSMSPEPPHVPDMRRTPGYPFFLAPFVTSFENPVFWIIAAQLLLSLMTCWILWDWAHKRWTSQAAWVSAAIVGLDWVTLAHTYAVLTESLFLLFYTLAILKTWNSLEDDSKGTFWAGLLWGITALIRPVVFYLPVLLAGLWWRNKKSALVFLLASYLLPGLWLLRNVTTAHYFGFTSNDGFSLLLYPASGIESMRTGVPITEVREKLLREVQATVPPGSSELVYHEAYRKKADAIIKSSYYGFLLYNAHGALRLLGGTGIEMLIDLLHLPTTSPGTSTPREPVLIRFSGTQALLRQYPALWPLHLGYLAALGILYVAFFFGIRQLWRARAHSIAAFLLLAFLYIIAISSHQGYYRFRIPLVPLLALSAGSYLSFRRR